MIQEYIKKREEEFEEKFTHTDVLGIRRLDQIIVTDRTADEPYFEDDLTRMIKKFNTQSLLGLLDLLKEEVEGMKMEASCDGIKKYCCHDDVLSDVIKLLTNKE